MPSRRDVIAGSTAAATVALAGCLDSLVSSGGSDEQTTTDWIAETVFGDTPVRVERPAELAAIGAFEYESLFVGELPGLADGDVDLVVAGRDGPFVLLGSFEAGTVVDGFEELSAGDTQSDGSYGGYDVYTDIRIEGSDGALLLGVDDGTAVVATERPRLETTVDASHGDATLLVDVDSRFEQLQAEFDGAPFYQVQRPDSERDVLLGVEAAIDEEETQVTLLTVHADATGAETFAGDAPDVLAGQSLVDTSVEVDGATVRVTGTRPTSEITGTESVAGLFGPVLRYFGDSGVGEPIPPQVAFEFDYDDDEGTLTVTVQSGDTFTAGQVTVQGSGFEAVGASWDELALDGKMTAESTVAAGDQVQLESVAPDVVLEFVWTAADGGDSAIVATFTGPAARY